jgi:hypothetical protein
MNAEREKELARLQMEIDVQVKEWERRSENQRLALNDEKIAATHLAQILETNAEAQMKSDLFRAKGQVALLTPEAIQVKMYESIANNTKIFFGPSVPTLFFGSMDSIMLQPKKNVI